MYETLTEYRKLDYFSKIFVKLIVYDSLEDLSYNRIYKNRAVIFLNGNVLPVQIKELLLWISIQ